MGKKLQTAGKITLRILDLGLQAYDPVLELQERLVNERKRGEISDTLILVEHEPVYTLGRNAKESNIIASRKDLERWGIQVIKTGRGGDVTYHGPGQLVGYPIISLSEREDGVLWFIENLEQVIVLSLADFGVQATTDRKNRGVWVGNEKIAAIGVRITRQITMHGFALNVSTNLDHYKGIIPCGIYDKGITSLHLLVPDISMKNVKNKVVEKFGEVFGYHEMVNAEC